MARRTLNRHELRKQADAAEQQTDGVAAAVETEAAPKKKSTRTKAAATPKIKKPRKKKEPPRLCARWGVFDNSMKQVATFAYNQRKEADQKVADLSLKKAGGYFIQIVKEPMAEEPAAAPAT